MRFPVRFRTKADHESPVPTSPPPRPAGALPVTACHAPSVQLFLNPDGGVLPCCRNLVGYGNIADQRLIDIWQGAKREELRRALAGDDFSLGCENCQAEIATEGAEHSYASFFEVRAGHLAGGPGADEWPRWIDFNISNSCNLQCVQCSGELSSSIRIHREKRAPLPKVYGEDFYEDLRLFIPHLDGALFAGGEPFLAAENYRVWDLIAELAPDLECTVTTNGTQWNDRVEAVLDRLRFNVVISLDAIFEDTYAAIRVGGHLPPVLANVERFRAYTERAGTRLSINHCLMVQNHHQFADLLLWAEGEGLAVDVSVVRAPSECAIARLPIDELRAVHQELARRDEEVVRALDRNLAVWRTEVDRIGAWAANAEAPGEDWASWGRWGRTVLAFRIEGDGPHDDRQARADLAGHAADGVVHALSVGPDDRIFACSPGLMDVLGRRDADIVGQPFDGVQHLATAHFGPLRRYEILRTTADRMDAVATYGETDLRMAMVALRGDDGRATEGRILISIGPAAPG